MKFWGLFLSCSMIVPPVAVFAYDDTAIIEYCDDEWGTDFSMVKYCRGQQRSAGKAYDLLKSQAETDKTVATILARCEGEWQTDYTMVIYCVEQQSSALRSLAASPDDVPPEVQEKISTHCSREWGDDFSMIAYCVKQQTSAWRDIQ